MNFYLIHKNENRRISVISFSLFCTWLISFPYQGEVFYSLVVNSQLDVEKIVLAGLICLVAGLSGCGFLVRSIRAAKFTMLVSSVFCLAGTCVFFFQPSVLWTVTLPAILFAAAVLMSSWGFYFKACTPKNARIQTAADVLVYSAVLMIPINLTAIYISARIGLFLAAAMLTLSFFYTIRLPDLDISEKSPCKAEDSICVIKTPLAFLCLFIAIITIDSGLMFSIVNPAFEGVAWLANWYWAVPYIAAIWLVKIFSSKINRTYILYIAISMIGLSFVAFAVLDRSAISYLVVNTLLLGGCGVFDVFWWNILGEMLDLGRNPAKILGLGLAANVFGVLLGALIASAAASFGISSNGMAMVALIVVCITFSLLPLLNSYLSRLLKNCAFFITLTELPEPEQKKTAEQLAEIAGLTKREIQVAAFLMKGYTYKLIADELDLSENTIKSHVSHIYNKLGVNNKSELLRSFADQLFSPSGKI